MKLRSEYTCPLEMTHDMIRGKWKPIILWQLSEEPQSLSALQHGITGISQKMLLQCLRELLSYGFVEKHSYEGYPLRVSYFLTDRGTEILEAIKIMQHIGIEIMKEDHKEAFLQEKGLL